MDSLFGLPVLLKKVIQHPWTQGLIILLSLVVCLAAMLLTMWLLVFPLRALGDALFITLAADQFEHLQRNVLLNQWWFFLPTLLWAFAVLSWAWAWPSEVKKLPRRDKRLRAARFQALLVRHARSFVLLNLICLVLAIPGMLSYNIVTHVEIQERSVFSWSPKVYPLAQFRCIERSVSSRGAIFQFIHFKNGETILVSGLNPAAIERIKVASGLPNLWTNDCRD